LPGKACAAADHERKTQMTASETESEFLTLHELVRAAHKKLDRNVWDYLIGGTETETTLLRNRQALDRLAFRPRVLRDVSSIDASHRFLGKKVRLPVVLAPVGGLEAFTADGGVLTARAASTFGIPFILSSVSEAGMQTVGNAASGMKVFQLYTRGDADWVDDKVRQAVELGYDAFCFTVDSAIYSRRERDITKRYAKPWRGRGGVQSGPGGMRYQAAFNWNDVRRVRDKFKIPIILKGIGTGEDAALACDEGVACVYVSNHGGRQLDHGLGAIEVLPEVVSAVAGRAVIGIDGGFSRGSDIVKALALGADIVGIGRAYCYGLVAGGSDGIVRVLELLETEIIECLGLLGVTELGGLSSKHVCKTEPVYPPHVHSAFPLIRLPQDDYS
jgi:isopentenyl diphosphate isomerase/L-lactate dehydrogenase-like FMN-dependent dehydrogenase